MQIRHCSNTRGLPDPTPNGTTMFGPRRPLRGRGNDVRGEAREAARHSGTIDDVIAAIYGEGAHQNRWSAVVEHIGELVGARACALATHDFADASSGLHGAVGFDDGLLDAYPEHYAHRNPWFASEAAYRWPSTVHRGADLVRDADLMATKFYKEWLDPQDLHHRLCAVVRRDGSKVLYVEALRPRISAPFGPGEVAAGRRLADHLRRASELNASVADAHAVNRATAETLDRLPLGVLVIDDSGTILSVNRRAGDILASDNTLSVRGERLCATDAEHAKVLNELIRNVLSSESAHEGTSLTRGDKPSPLAIKACTVSDGKALRDRPATVVILINDPDLPHTVDEASIRDLHGLTRVEAQLASLLVLGHSVDAAAAELGISWHTARSYLKQIFAKTGVKRQVDLVRVLFTGPAQLHPLPRNDDPATDEPVADAVGQEA